jgi:AcrR family transcriptional regulator
MNERSFPPQRSEAMPPTAAVLPAADQRVTDILIAVRRAFAEKGFDGASMQDLARAAGMSVGNFYRYFPSKAAIVDALIAHDVAEMQADFATILTANNPMAALRARIQVRLRDEACAEDGRLWAEITAAALRRPEIGTACLRMEAGITDNLATVFARVTGRPLAEARAMHATRAAFIILLFKAAMMLPRAPEAPREALHDMILQSIDRVLDDIEADRREP